MANGLCLNNEEDLGFADVVVSNDTKDIEIYDGY